MIPIPTKSLRLRGFILGLALIVARTGAFASPGIAVPRFTHPGDGQVFYFVLTDRFANGNPGNDTGGYSGGRDEHGFDPTAISHFHGGDFAGMLARLDYMQGLGVSAIWVTPPFWNKPVQSGTAGYHGYWVLDFLKVDPHLGTNEEFAELVRQAHARGMRVFMDIIVNHTADVIVPQGGTEYVSLEDGEYRDAAGKPFDPAAVAYNGQGKPDFPELSAARSFPRPPTVPEAEVNAKTPAWLNDVTLYHNRGNTTFEGENALYGDFVGLDDLFTEHPRVVQGFIEVFTHWIKELGVDGFRIDTMKHVNMEFWQAFSPAIREVARENGRPAFLQFGEVATEGNPEFLSEFSTHGSTDTSLDFGFFTAARKFVSQRGGAAEVTAFFATDDLYTDHDGNVHATTTFLGNHDAGRFAYFLQQDNPGASMEELASLSRFGHGLLLLARGQPVIYYGDEQGMIGTGNDMLARESMFPARAPEFVDLPLLGTSRRGSDDKFDPEHPLYRFIGDLARLRRAHPALMRGAMLSRPTTSDDVFAFSRIERDERVEYLVAMNSARTRPATVSVRTSQPARAEMELIFDSQPQGGTAEKALAVKAEGAVAVSLQPLQFKVWRARQPLGAPAEPLSLAIVTPRPGATLSFETRKADGNRYGGRREIRAEVSGGGGLAEVTFVMERASRPGQYELLGVDDAPPYRVYWRPPADMADDEKVKFVATVSDLRGRQAVDEVDHIGLAPDSYRLGTRGAISPGFTTLPPASVAVGAGETVELSGAATGTGPIRYQWLVDGREIEGATGPRLEIKAAKGDPVRTYVVLARNLLGTAVSSGTTVEVR